MLVIILTIWSAGSKASSFSDSFGEDNDEAIILLVNYIREVEDESARKDGIIMELETALRIEREKVAEVIEHRDKIIELQDLQIEDYKKLIEDYERQRLYLEAQSKKSKLYNALGATGLATFIFAVFIR